MPKTVYFFGSGQADGSAALKDLLGGKGAGLADMTNAGLPVPPGFTIATSACRQFFAAENKLAADVEEEIAAAVARLEQLTGRKLGNPENPLLVSVRSGAKFSMPGMMDTILNLGLNDRTVGALARRANARFAWDCYRRFIQMFGNVVLGIGKDKFDTIFEAAKKKRKVHFDTELDARALEEVVKRYQDLVKRETGKPFPQDPREQLRMARDAVFKSWYNPRARTYRAMYNISEDLGTAVNVQTMVFGNLGERSGTGVAFTRNPATGEKKFYGEFLMNAQGEDVVAGIRTPVSISGLGQILPEVYEQLQTIAQRLERHYRDMQDFEFTIQDGKLYMLQTRNGKRTGLAALRIAVHMVDEGLISADEALLRVEPEQLDQLLHPVFERKAREKFKAAAKGLGAGPGAASGVIVFTADEAVVEARQGKPVVLVRPETSPEDVHGMAAARGILTATGGMTSHAAVVSRGMGKPCVVGCKELLIDLKGRTVSVDGKRFRAGQPVSIDGTTGEVIFASLPTVESELIRVAEGSLRPEESEVYEYFKRFMSWADANRRLGIRTNADLPEDARLARGLGAEGIGLCRTEHMFFAKERLPHMQTMILASAEKERRQALAKLLPMQRNDFKGLFRAMAGLPVTIRLLDPPLHEFLPKREELRLQLDSHKRKKTKSLAKTKRLLERVEQLHELNPMLGHRGCRLGITHPEVSEMQARAIFEAACEVAAEGIEVFPEVMVPLVGEVRELELQRMIIDRAAEEVFRRKGRTVRYLVGTMIELPRAALTADEIARQADFFSFGTNDLTQTTYGFSRDDTAALIQRYQELGIFKADPFQVLDRRGVGELVRVGTERGRKVKPNLKVGICGEHGGDPASVEFCHSVGLDYVSCSPFRVPIARLAAAQATVKEKLAPEAASVTA
ncbi:MAG: pyruvate, phosphate dikinase [Acidobacteria bacterium]|nr:pyruvate, phosphate dikinase [Acidobacteriota bacterium]